VAFSLRDAPPPFHWKIVRPRSRMKTSPEFMLDAATGCTCSARTRCAPLSRSSRGLNAAPRGSSTATRAESTPPGRYSTTAIPQCFLSIARKSSDSWACVSRYCTGVPPSESSSSTLLYAATPFSSCEVSEPSQKWMSHCSVLECSRPLVCRQMYESPTWNWP
jgi:hypothetical protein